MVEVKRKPGRPRKVEVKPTEGETPATVVKPVPDPESDPNPVVEVERVHHVTGEVLEVYQDEGFEVELPNEPINAVESGQGGNADAGEASGLAGVFGGAGGTDSGGLAEAISLSPAEVEAAKNVYVIPDDVTIEKPVEPGPVVLSPQQVVALDRDFDGEAGGSRPVASLTELQRDAFSQDVIDAYEGQFEVKRTDAFNRVWSFRHEIVKNMDHMLIEARRGQTVSQQLISTALFSKGQAMVAIETADAETSR